MAEDIDPFIQTINWLEIQNFTHFHFLNHRTHIDLSSSIVFFSSPNSEPMTNGCNLSKLTGVNNTVRPHCCCTQIITIIVASLDKFTLKLALMSLSDQFSPWYHTSQTMKVTMMRNKAPRADMCDKSCNTYAIRRQRNYNMFLFCGVNCLVNKTATTNNENLYILLTKLKWLLKCFF